MSCSVPVENQEIPPEGMEVESKMPPDTTDLSGNEATTEKEEREPLTERWQAGKSGAMITADSSGELDISLPTDQVDNVKKGWSVKRFRGFCGTCVNNNHVQSFIVFLILINAIMMGVATFDFVTKNSNVSGAFEVTDQVFLIIFTVELCFQFVYHGLSLFTDGWLVFDFVIIFMSWSLASLRIVRTFRIFRALRLVTRVEVLKNLVTALFSVGPRMCGIGALLMLIFYIYGVMCTVLFKDLYANDQTDYDYFSRLDRSFWTLFVMMTLDWTNVSRQVMKVYPWSWGVFVSFVMISSFMVYNLVIAVVCDSVAIIEASGKEDNMETLQHGEIENLGHVRELSKRVDVLAAEQTVVLEALLAALEQAGVESPLLVALSDEVSPSTPTLSKVGTTPKEGGEDEESVPKLVTPP
jgi:Ion transport protein